MTGARCPLLERGAEGETTNSSKMPVSVMVMMNDTL